MKGDRRIPLAGLQDEGVTRRDRDRKHPNRNHRRKVEGRNPGADAERLSEGERVDTAGDLVGVLALRRDGSPHANSTTSSPRWISPSASERTMPCSEEIILAISPMSRRSSSRNANRTWLLRTSPVFAHPGKADRAAAIADSTSAVSARMTSPVAAPVAGS
jgi:hypothetical protein